MDVIRDVFKPYSLKLWASSLLLAMALKSMQTRVSHPLFVPCFYALVPLIFFLFAMPILGYNIDELRQAGWLFDFGSNDVSVPFYEYLTYYRFDLINWNVVARCFPTMLALTFFGLLHVPINIPALSVSTDQEFDINREVIAHGVSNLISGFCGTPQNYLVYTNSVLFIRSGGESRTAGVILGIVMTLFFFLGGKAVSYVPTLVVGALIFHLSIEVYNCIFIRNSWSRRL